MGHPPEHPPEHPTEHSLEHIMEHSTDQLVDRPMEQPADQQMVQPAVQQMELTADQVTEQPAEQELIQPAEEHVVQRADQPPEHLVDHPMEQPAEQQVFQQIVQPAEQQAVQPAIQPVEQSTDQSAEQPAQKELVQPAQQQLKRPRGQPPKKHAARPVEQPTDTPKKHKNPGKSWSDIELRYIWDVVQEQRNEGMAWKDCAIAMHLEMRKQNHVRRRYEAHSLLQAWKKYFTEAAKNRGTFDYINSAPLAKRPPPRQAPNNSRYVVKSHYRPQQVLIATSSRSAASWGYGTEEFEQAVEDGGASAAMEYEDEDEEFGGNDELSNAGGNMRSLSRASKEVSSNDRYENDDDDEFPDVNELTKQPARSFKASERPVARSLPPRASKSSKPLVDYSSDTDDSLADDDDDYDNQAGKQPRKRIKGVIVHAGNEIEFDYGSESGRPAASSTFAQSPHPENQLSFVRRGESEAEDTKFPPTTAPRPHNVFDVPIGLPHQADIEYPYKTPSIKSDPSFLAVPPQPTPRNKPGPKPWRPDPSNFKAKPSRASLDAHMTQGTGVYWQDPGRILTYKQKQAKKREELMASREARIKAGIKVPALKKPRVKEVPPPLIPQNFKGNALTQLQALHNQQLMDDMMGNS
ncbi:hypothetical protein HYALB_00003688 [Hymenoscyphus albidus]|uniref:Myb-like domain-containing protein n=1 Tax=Hymenoscyphus albidus TaxID=595503 RepID=A0A9N9LEJ8_9HELO|nr:hypothetical protein HYALB_00003688 [Hymenoscyphus albidus]